MKVTKTLNSFSFEEHQIFDMETYNFLIGLDTNRIVCPIKRVAGGFVESIDKKNKVCNTFSLFEDEITDYQDLQIIKRRANGFLAHLKRLTYPNFNEKYIRAVEGPLNSLDPEDFPNLKFKYINEREVENVSCIDINSSYLAILGEGYFPNVNERRERGIVQKGEVGFLEGSGVLKMVGENDYADVIFPLSYSEDLAKWTREKYKELKKYKKHGDKVAYSQLKTAIVSMIGSVRNHNAYLYVFIIHKAKQKILNLIDENCIMCNTDSITYCGERPDLEGLIGDDLGEFKFEYKNCKLIRPNYNTNYIVFNEKGELVKKVLKGLELNSYDGFDENYRPKMRVAKYELRNGDRIYERV